MISIKLFILFALALLHSCTQTKLELIERILDTIVVASTQSKACNAILIQN